MPLYYIELRRDPAGIFPEHLRPSTGEDACEALNELREQFEPDLRVLVTPDGELDAYAVIRLSEKIETFTAKTHWRDSLRERSLAVVCIERVYEHAEIRGPGKFWLLNDRGPSGWLAVSVEDNGRHGHPSGELVVLTGDRQKPAQRLADVAAFFRPRTD